MNQFVVSPAAVRDISTILLRSQIQLGLRARKRYEELIIQAIRDVAVDPDRPGTVATAYVNVDSLIYHLKHSRRNVSKVIGRVQHPRHLLLCRLNASGMLEIARVIHENLQIDQRLLGD